MRCARALALSGTVLAGVAVMSSCQSTKSDEEAPSAISKVDYYHLKSTSPQVLSQDRMITTEAKKYLHGAVTTEERRQRLGHYYTIYWKVEDKQSPVNVTFNYRQSGKDSDLKQLTEEITDHKGKGATKLQITGDDYLEDGRVLMWEAIVTQNGEVVGVERSFLWN